MRCPQPVGERGSLKWMQLLVNEHPKALNDAILERLPKAHTIEWRSPLRSDDFAEYRDADFLKQIGTERLAADLRAFWPERGPQWDGLACSHNGDVLLVEAKAHISELCSSAIAASDQSRQQIEAALRETAHFLKAEPRASWSTCFYQLTNRLAHLYFLRHQQDVPAWLVLTNFVGDAEMDGPTSEAEWKAAYQIVWHVLGINRSHELIPYVIELHPDIRKIFH